MSDTDQAREEIEAFTKKIGVVREEIGRVIVGQRAVIDGVLTCMLAGSHALIAVGSMTHLSVLALGTLIAIYGVWGWALEPTD